MISNVYFENCWSFAEGAEISFEVSENPRPTDFDIHYNDGARLNKLVALYGPNASGKTQALKPLVFLAWFVSASFRLEPEESIPIEPHALYSEEPINFEVEFYIQDTKYRYQLKICNGAVEHESLHKKTSRKYSVMFTRDLVDSKYVCKLNNFSVKKAFAEQTRGNVSLISRAYYNDVKDAEIFVRYFESCRYNIDVHGRNTQTWEDIKRAAVYFAKNKEYLDQVTSLLSDLDLGLSGIRLEDETIPDKEGKQQKVIIPYGIHGQGENQFTLPFVAESSGTKSTFVLFQHLLPVLNEGGIAIIDELDNDLHIHLLYYLIDLFKGKETNPHDAQLLFTCHSPQTMKELQKHQIYLTEKNNLLSLMAQK
mgnify:CR=1 FL=1